MLVPGAVSSFTPYLDALDQAMATVLNVNPNLIDVAVGTDTTDPARVAITFSCFADGVDMSPTTIQTPLNNILVGVDGLNVLLGLASNSHFVLYDAEF